MTISHDHVIENSEVIVTIFRAQPGVTAQGTY